MHHRPRHSPLTALALAALAVAALAGCGPGGVVTALGDGAPAVAEGVATESAIRFGAPGGAPLLLDACVPDAAPDPAPAVVLIHGGSWARGARDSADWRRLCALLAGDGYAAFSIDYRLAPAWTFPAQLDDVQAAIAWLREGAQAERFNLDTTRIGLVGASAGGHLASLAGVVGEGELTTGTRVAAVVELSAPILLTGVAEPRGLTDDRLAFLGCASDADCPAALEASPTSHIDATDPPFLVVHATDEYIPIEQATILVDALEAAAVPVEYVEITGTGHATELLDAEVEARILAFLAEHLVGERVTAAG